MLGQLELQYLEVRAYLENRQLARAFLPDGQAGVYWFVRDLTDLFTSKDGGRLNAWLETPQRWFSATLPPYFAVKIASKVKPLNSAKQAALGRLVQKFGARRIAEPLLFSQRPLYVGESANLRARLLDHLEGRSDLEDQLNSIGLGLVDCTIVWIITEEQIVEVESPDSESSSTEPSSREVLEALAIRLCQPILNRKIE